MGTSYVINASMKHFQRNTDRAVERLSELLDVQNGDLVVEGNEGSGDSKLVDAIISGVGRTFAVEFKTAGSLASVVLATSQLKASVSSLPEDFVPVLAVPFMSKSGREHCKNVGVSWLDFSGNARIVAPGLYVYVDGHQNKFRRSGRPETPFGPSGSRVARWLLMHPEEVVRQRALASATGLNEGHVSRVAGKLIDLELMERDESGVRVRHPGRLLDAWQDEYRFDKHRLIQGHIPVRAGESVVQQVVPLMNEIRVCYALTGLAAAWEMSRHAGFRLSTIYLEEEPSEDLLRSIGFREEPRGSNTWLVIPNDEGVFQGARDIHGTRCVHPVQVYLDLKDHPERASEAAAELRRELFSVGTPR